MSGELGLLQSQLNQDYAKALRDSTVLLEYAEACLQDVSIRLVNAGGLLGNFSGCLTSYTQMIGLVIEQVGIIARDIENLDSIQESENS